MFEDTSSYTLLKIDNLLIEINKQHIAVNGTTYSRLKNPVITTNKPVILTGILSGNYFTLIDNTRFVVDKILISNLFVISNSYQKNNKIYIGNNIDNTNKFNGYIPLVFVYQRILTQLEMKLISYSLHFGPLKIIDYYYNNINLEAPNIQIYALQPALQMSENTNTIVSITDTIIRENLTQMYNLKYNLRVLPLPWPISRSQQYNDSLNNKCLNTNLLQCIIDKQNNFYKTINLTQLYYSDVCIIYIYCKLLLNPNISESPIDIFTINMYDSNETVLNKSNILTMYNYNHNLLTNTNITLLTYVFDSVTRNIYIYINKNDDPSLQITGDKNITYNHLTFFNNIKNEKYKNYVIDLDVNKTNMIVYGVASYTHKLGLPWTIIHKNFVNSIKSTSI